jgi:hypothetical protein
MRNAIPRLLFVLLAVTCPGAAVAASPSDLTAPDVRLLKLSFKLNDIEYSVEAPEGAIIEMNAFGAVITKGKDFGFTIELGKKHFVSDKGRWKQGVGTYVPKEFIISKKDRFIVETAAGGEQRFSAAAAVDVAYVDLTVRSVREGLPDANIEALPNCLLVLKCARTIAPVIKPPKEPAALLERLKADVRKDDNGDVQSVALPASATDGALRILDNIPTLKSLTIAGNSITDDGLAELDGMKNLEEFGMVCQSITDGQLVRIGEIPNLKTLSLGAAIGTADIDEKGLAHLKDLTGLQTLDLTNTRAGDVALACFKDMTSLKVLRLGSTLATDKREGPQRTSLSTLTDEGLASLAKLTSLQTLSLHRTDITGVGFKHLAGLKKLENLELNDTFVNDEGLEQIGKIESLRILQIARTNITGAGLKHLANLEELKELDLTDTAVDDNGLGHISIHNHLESLSLRRSHVTDAGMLHLESLRHLEALNLSETKITDAGLPHLYRLKNLQSLYTSDTAVTQDALDKLDKARESQ